jgi:hypothetical protein
VCGGSRVNDGFRLCIWAQFDEVALLKELYLSPLKSAPLAGLTSGIGLAI